MPSDRVVFSFFRYPPSHALGAFILMGFQGLARDRDLPPGALRLLGCGGGDGFSIVPDFSRYCLMSAPTHPGDLARIRASALYRRVAGPASERLHFSLRPASGHGTWDGETPFRYSGRTLGERPFAVLTRARVLPARMTAFWRDVPAIRRDLRGSSGCLYQVGFGEHPLLTLATFSVWRDLEAMRAFAYGQTAHRLTIRESRGERWLSESLFVRFEIESVEGDLRSYPRLSALMSGRSPSA